MCHVPVALVDANKSSAHPGGVVSWCTLHITGNGIANLISLIIICRICKVVQWATTNSTFEVPPQEKITPSLMCYYIQLKYCTLYFCCWQQHTWYYFVPKTSVMALMFSVQIDQSRFFARSGLHSFYRITSHWLLEKYVDACHQ